MAFGRTNRLVAILEAQDRASPVIRGLSNQLQLLGGVATAVGAVALGRELVRGMSAAVRASSEFEQSFTGVRKTVDATEQQFARLRSELRQLAAGPDAIPVDVNELNRVAEAAGQLGIETRNLVDFTRVMAELGVTTNLSSEEAATSLARLANITGLQQTEFRRLGSTVVDLGNNFATTEREIVDLSLRLAGAGSQIGLTEGQILAFATALSSVGIAAESGGTALSRVFVDIAKSVETGGERLERFAAVAGVSTEEFARAFRQDAAEAIRIFIAGLGRVSDSGEGVFQLLKDLGLDNVRVRDALLRTSGASELLRRALDRQAVAWSENSALTKESAQFFATFDNQTKLLDQSINDIAISLGDALKPSLGEIIRSGLLPLTDQIRIALEETTAFRDISVDTGVVVLQLADALLSGAQALDSFGAGLNPVSEALDNIERRLAKAQVALALLTAFVDSTPAAFRRATEAAAASSGAIGVGAAQAANAAKEALSEVESASENSVGALRRNIAEGMRSLLRLKVPPQTPEELEAAGREAGKAVAEGFGEGLSEGLDKSALVRLKLAISDEDAQKILKDVREALAETRAAFESGGISRDQFKGDIEALSKIHDNLRDLNVQVEKLDPTTSAWVTALNAAVEPIKGIGEEFTVTEEEAEAVLDPLERWVETLRQGEKAVYDTNAAIRTLIDEGAAGLRASLVENNARLESFGEIADRNLRGLGVDAALDFGDTLVDAASGADVSFRDFFKNLLNDLSRAIVRALILRAILSFAGGAGAGAGAGFGASLGGSRVGLRHGGLAAAGGPASFLRFGGVLQGGAGPPAHAFQHGGLVEAMLQPRELLIPPGLVKSTLGAFASGNVPEGLGRQLRRSSVTVPGVDLGRDTVPAALPPGTLVIPTGIAQLVKNAAASGSVPLTLSRDLLRVAGLSGEGLASGGYVLSSRRGRVDPEDVILPKGLRDGINSALRVTLGPRDLGRGDVKANIPAGGFVIEDDLRADLQRALALSTAGVRRRVAGQKLVDVPVVPFFAEGGLVPDVGLPRIDARLDTGDAVLPQRLTKELRRAVTGVGTFTDGRIRVGLQTGEAVLPARLANEIKAAVGARPRFDSEGFRIFHQGGTVSASALSDAAGPSILRRETIREVVRDAAESQVVIRPEIHLHGSLPALVSEISSGAERGSLDLVASRTRGTRSVRRSSG